MKRKLLELLIATSSLLAVSCSQSEDFVLPDNGNGEEVTVSFTVSAADGTLSTRAGHISDGTKATKLVYAVYSPEYYQEGDEGYDADNPLKIKYYLLKQYGDNGAEGNGQTVVMNPDDLLGDGYKFSLRLMRGKTYCIAFWAQDPECKAYNTDDLKNVTVDYSAAKNNDELRDAFSAAISFEAQPKDPQTAILTRAMAQINVGTAGWDYLAEVAYGYRYAYSQMVVTGVYDNLNVLTEEVSRQTVKKDEEITFGWNKIPAYINISDVDAATDGDGFPTFADAKEVTPSQMKKLEDFLLTKKEKQTDEEFLYVKLTPQQGTDDDTKYEKGQGNYKNTHFLKYLEEIPTEDLGNEYGIYTEVFKYLSMCYVLAPKHDELNKDEFEGNGTIKGGTAVTVQFYMAESADGKIYELRENEDATASQAETGTSLKVLEPTGKQIFSIYNVPVQRNWRTNILGGTGLDGDDTTSLFNPRYVKCLIDIDPGYNGEHNTTDSGSHWETWKPSDEDGNGGWEQTEKWPEDAETPQGE